MDKTILHQLSDKDYKLVKTIVDSNWKISYIQLLDTTLAKSWQSLYQQNVNMATPSKEEYENTAQLLINHGLIVISELSLAKD